MKAAPVLRAIAFVVAYLVSSIALGIAAVALPQFNSFYLTLLSVVIPVLLVVLFRRLWDGRSVASLGLQVEPGSFAKGLLGAGLGVALISLVFLIELAAGWLSVKAHFTLGSVGLFFLIMLFVLFMGSAVSAFAEELVFRGYLLQNLIEGLGPLPAMVVTSLLFGFGHLSSPSFSLMIGLNLSLAGLFLAYAYLVSDSLWLPIGFHLAWNFFEGYVYGLPVSGLRLGMISLLISKSTGPVWATGGVFGPEGGLIGTAAFLTGFLVLWFAASRIVRQSA